MSFFNIPKVCKCRYLPSSLVAPLAGQDGAQQAPTVSRDELKLWLLVCCSGQRLSGGLVQPGGGKAVRGAPTVAASCGFAVKLQLGSLGKCPEAG